MECQGVRGAGQEILCNILACILYLLAAHRLRSRSSYGVELVDLVDLDLGVDSGS